MKQLLILSLAVFVLSSCSSLRKLKHNVKITEQVKTSEVTTAAKDSAVTTITKQVDSSGTTVTVLFDVGVDSSTTVDITYPAHKEDYLTDRTIGIKTNRKPKSITVNQAQQKEDVQQVAAAVKTNESKAAETDKTTTTKAKQVEKKKTGIKGWLIIAAIIVCFVILWLEYEIPPLQIFIGIKKFFTKNSNMKSLVILLTVTLLFSSCWKNSKPIPPRLLEPAVYAEKRVPVRIDTGFRKVPGHFENGVWVPQQYKFDSLMVVEWATVPIYDYEVVMNGKQTMKYSYLSGYRVKQFVGIFFILVLIWIVFNTHIANDHNHLQKAKLMLGNFVTPIEVYTRGNAVGWARGVALLAIVALAFLTLTPGRIAQNNAKTITEDQYKHYSGIDPELNYFWDSVFNKGAIDGAKKPK